jgi:tuberous sclerosis 2
MSEPDRLRPRANTASFTSFPWRKTRQEQESHPPVLPQLNLSLQELIDVLVPPAVPSLVHARALATTLSSVSPLPPRDLLNPILLSLCDPDSPPLLQAAGHDILSAYFDNHEALSLGVPERFSYLSLFLGVTMTWGMELWEPRFKALRSLTRYGVDIMGIETTLINILKSWIQGAFDGLLKPPSSIDRSERAERERSVDVLVKFLGDVLQKTETMARISEEIMSDVLKFYASLVHRSIASPYAKSALSIASESLNTPKPPPPLSHRRNLSSLSSSSIPSLLSSPLPMLDTPTFKQPAELAIDLYLNNLSLHIKTLPAVYLNSILPVLFISLSFCSAFLPQMTVKQQTPKKGTLEDKITETLNALFGGPYSATCMLVLRQYLFPPGYTLEKGTLVTPFLDALVDNPQNPRGTVSRMALLISRGAHRTLRIYVRRALSVRLARAYISRETSTAYSEAPGHIELEVDLMAKDDYSSHSAGIGSNGWEAGSLGRALAQSVGAWVDYNLEIQTSVKHALEKERQGKDEILEEIAGLLKDILQELDVRLEENGTMDDEEAEVVGLALFKLSGYVLPLK